MTEPEIFLDGRVTLWCGNVLDVLEKLPADHFDCVVTSPPYWGLRSYLSEDSADKHYEIGLEPSLGQHLSVIVDIFREVRRILKPEGVCWINYGDCYATSVNGRSAADTKALGNDDRTFRDKPFSTVGPVFAPDAGNPFPVGRKRRGGGNAPKGGYLKAKDMCLIPERLWIALQDDGWWIRSKFPWIKRNGMPERAEDRPANSLEQMAMLTKSARYWYDAESIRKAASASTNARVAQNVAAQAGSARANGGAKTNGPMKAVVRKLGCGPKSAPNGTNIKAKDSFHASTTEVLNDRNFRNTDLFFSSVEAPWGLISDSEGTPLAIDANPKGFSEAHFATFPPALIEPLIMAGCPAGGSILDPFGGSGTTAIVAVALGRSATMIELNPEYCTLARARIEAAFMGKDEGSRHMVRRLGKIADAGPLFGGQP
jgi:DNA modification methylase